MAGLFRDPGIVLVADVASLALEFDIVEVSPVSRYFPSMRCAWINGNPEC